MSAPLSPEQFCFRYMWPCAELRRSRREISEEDYIQLRLYRDNPSEKPKWEVLWRCFPNATKDISLLGIAKNRDPWTLENVIDYWHHHHEGASPVRIFQITERRVDGFVVLLYPRNSDSPPKTSFLFNSFDLDANPSDLVYGHVYHAIEKVEFY